MTEIRELNLENDSNMKDEEINEQVGMVADAIINCMDALNSEKPFGAMCGIVALQMVSVYQACALGFDKGDFTELASSTFDSVVDMSKDKENGGG